MEFCGALKWSIITNCLAIWIQTFLQVGKVKMLIKTLIVPFLYIKQKLTTSVMLMSSARCYLSSASPRTLTLPLSLILFNVQKDTIHVFIRIFTIPTWKNV